MAGGRNDGKKEGQIHEGKSERKEGEGDLAMFLDQQSC